MIAAVFIIGAYTPDQTTPSETQSSDSNIESKNANTLNKEPEVASKSGITQPLELIAPFNSKPKPRQKPNSNQTTTETIDKALADLLDASREKMTVSKFRLLDTEEELYKYFVAMHKKKPLRFRLLDNQEDFISVRKHIRGELIITHTTVDDLNSKFKDNDSFLENASEEMHALDSSSTAAAENIEFITQVVFPLASHHNINIFDFSCSTSQCILLTTYHERENVLAFENRIENQQRYTVVWSFPLRDSKTETIYLFFR